MTIVKLVLVNLLLVVGMIYLPSVSGSGTGSLVTRVWLGFGLLVFVGNYFYYLDESDRRKAKKAAAAFRARRRSLPAGERSSAHR